MKILADLLTTPLLKSYIDKAEQIRKLNILWSHYLQSWAEHCSIANFDGKQLVLLVNNASWATRLRFDLPEIKKTLLNLPEFTGLESIRFQVIYTPLQAIRPPIKFRDYTLDTSIEVIKAAETIINKDIKASFLRLANSIEGNLKSHT